MELKAFKERLLTDPDFNDPEIVAARRSDPAFEAIATEAASFEALLRRSLQVRPPPRLAETIILRHSTQIQRRPETPWMLATAAALMLAVGAVSFNLFQTGTEHARHADVWSHLDWHWQYDGARAMEMSQIESTEPTEVVGLLASLGVNAEPELLSQVQLGKACPTPNGRGAHLILTTQDGPITLMILPNTQVPNAPTSATLANGMEAWVVNLEHGSMAVIAEPGRLSHQLARQLQQQVSTSGAIEL